MDFNEWCEKNMPYDIEEIDRDYIRMGWNGAIDAVEDARKGRKDGWNEAIEKVMQVIDQSGCGGDSDEFIKNIISKLKKK